MVFQGSESVVANRELTQNVNASLGYRTQSHCGRSYEELASSPVWSACPWTLDVHVDYNTSIFDAKFLEKQYAPFLNQIGAVSGMAASAKASFGPFAFVGEFNGATKAARFFDALGTLKTIKPQAWQLSVAYQFDWNPWVREIGAQGNFLSVSYSGTKDMAGATANLDGQLSRVGFVPESRLAVTAGEWVTDEVKVVLEYSVNWDYPVSQGGTGKVANGVFGLVSLNF
jgi:hypothetical protein